MRRRFRGVKFARFQRWLQVVLGWEVVVAVVRQVHLLDMQVLLVLGSLGNLSVVMLG